MPAAARGQRWSPVSGSANVDTAYRELWKTPEKAYQYVCWCRPPFPGESSDSDSDDDEEEDDDEDNDGGDEEKENNNGDNNKPKKKPSCDGGKTCLCNKPANDHPNHIWVTTFACRRKFFAQESFVQMRDPDNFGMSTYNDHAGYGVLQVVENLLLDFVEADSNWREQWVVCETLAMFLQTDMIEPMLMIDDAEGLGVLLLLAGRTFLSMLARLEREKLLSENSEIKNLGLIMSLWVKNANAFQSNDLFENAEEETVELKALDGSTQSFTFDLGNFDDYVLAYVNRHSITLPWTFDTEGAAENCPIPTLEDPWNTAAAFIKYEEENGKSNGDQKPTMGGDSLDITTWSSAERKAASMNRRDPLSKREITALRMGFMLGWE